ncbi:glycosyltransferase [Nitrincola schmidtii]|uniref:glycosyltransferase n=1 Tax=Nitrincola schmidtii TaxID=1730894 RepID=UPI00124DA026|nr:glycosyltransferase [Nitrincola schmidtii]
MKILQICGAQKAGGAEAHFLRFCIELNKHEDMDVVAIVRKDSWLEEQLNKEDIKVYALGFRSSFDLITSLKILKISLKEKSDIIQCWMNRAATLTPKRARGFKIGRLGGYYSLKNYKSMDWLVGATNDICNHITQNGWHSDKLSCIPNFVNLPSPEEQKASDNLKNELGLNDKTVLFTPARLHSVKGLDTAIKALKLLPDQFCYLIVGNGPEEDTLKKLANHLGVQDRVIFAGWQNDITPFCYISDIFLVPSRHEPFGSVLLEAWSHKKPLVTSDSQGALAITEDNKTSLMFNKDNHYSLAEKVSILQSNASLKSLIVENGYNELISKYVASSVLNTYTSLYKKSI